MRKILAIHSNEDDFSGILERINRLFPETIVMTKHSSDGALALAHVEQPDVILVGSVPGREEEEFLCKRLKEMTSTRHIPVIRLISNELENTLVENSNNDDSGTDVFLSRHLEDREIQS